LLILGDRKHRYRKLAVAKYLDLKMYSFK